MTADSWAASILDNPVVRAYLDYHAEQEARPRVSCKDCQFEYPKGEKHTCQLIGQTRTDEGNPVVVLRAALTEDQVDRLTDHAFDAWAYNERWPREKSTKKRLHDVVVSVLAHLDEVLCK